MRTILAACNRDILQQFAATRVLLAFDYDGTLAPIAATPARATMRAGTRALLRRLCRRYPCAVISGRARRDVAGHLRATGVFAVVGNHGMEPGGPGAGPQATVRRWRRHLRSQLADYPGVVIEDKQLSLSVHYRASDQKRGALAAIHRAMGQLPAVRVIGGKDVVNLVPAGATHKGLALERLRRRAGCDAAIYVGDDETDEDVFGYRSRWPLLGIRVGHSRTTGATYCIRRQAEIDGLLRALLDCRDATGARTRSIRASAANTR
jgi:trehalose 6-phosphate phosphatase